jgi:hypothetical protein
MDVVIGHANFEANRHRAAAYSGFHLERKLTSKDTGAPPARGVGRSGGGWPYQCLSFKLDPSGTKCTGSGTEITPGKHSGTIIKPLPLANGHGRYMTATPERALVSVGEWPLHMAGRDIKCNFCAIA